MERRISITDNASVPGEAILDAHAHGDAIIIEQGGEELAAVISIEEYRRLRRDSAGETNWLERARRSRERIAERRGAEPFPSIDDIINDMRADRDDQLLDNLR